MYEELLKEEKNISDNNNNNNNIHNKEDKSEEYQYGLDIVRLIAMLLVVTFHGLTFNFLLNTNINTFILFICDVICRISYSCLGLFMILTGYLKRNKKPSSSYYIKIIQFIIEYILCYIICELYHIYYLKEEKRIKEIIEGIFTFNSKTHVWYVKMYIGLFLLSPYLNVIYNNIKTRKDKNILLIIIIIIYSLPYSYEYFGWRYWGTGYPVMYYLIGCYIREYQPCINRIYCIIIIIIMSIIQAILHINSKVITVYNYYNLGCVIITVTIFLLFYNLKVKKKNKICKILRKITDTSFSFFLLNHIIESIFYYNKFVDKGYNTFMKRLPHVLYIMPIAVIVGIISSFITHTLSIYITNFIMNIVIFVKEKIKEKKMI